MPLNQAKANRSDMIAFERRLLEADQLVATEKANSGLQLDLSADFSLSQFSSNF